MANLTVEVDGVCARCGTRLTVERVADRVDSFDVVVEPCPKCLDEARSQGATDMVGTESPFEGGER